MDGNNKNLPNLLFIAVFAIFCAVSVVFMNYYSPKKGTVSDLPLVRVYVKGAVKRPGVYEMEVTDRVEDAVKKAGGKLENGDISNLDLARFLEDGETLNVPLKGQIHSEEKVKIVREKININTAPKESLMTLEGIGEGLAERIVEYREVQGDFGDIGDIMNVPGIGQKKFEAIKDSICIN